MKSTIIEAVLVASPAISAGKVGGAMKSMHRTPAGKLIISVPALRAELAADKWRLATVALAYGETPSAVKAALKITRAGQALLAEYMQHRPKSGPSGPSGKRVAPRGPRIELNPTPEELEQLRTAAGDEPLGPWILRRALEGS